MLQHEYLVVVCVCPEVVYVRERGCVCVFSVCVFGVCVADFVCEIVCVWV